VRIPFIRWSVVVGLLTLVLGPQIAMAQLAVGSWPILGHDLRHTAQSDLLGPQTGLVLWRALTVGFVKGSPIVGPDGTIYLGISKGFCAIEPVTATPKWCTTLGGTIRRNAPTLSADGTLYIGDRNNRLNAIAAADGTHKWSYAVGNDGDVSTSPAIAPDGTIYMVGTGAGIVHAFNPAGTLLWKRPLGGFVVYSSPALGADGTIYVGNTNGDLCAVSPAGVLLWKANLKGGIRFGSPSIGADGTIYQGSTGGIGAVSPEGDVLWQREEMGYVATAPAIAADGTIYVAGQKGFYALNPDGSVRWSLVTGERFRSSPVIGSDGVIYTGAGRRVVALRPNGTLLWEFTLRRQILAQPAIGPNGVLYVGADGFYAFQD